MTPEKIEELRAVDERIANAVVACDAAYLELKNAIEAKNVFCTGLNTI